MTRLKVVKAQLYGGAKKTFSPPILKLYKFLLVCVIARQNRGKGIYRYILHVEITLNIYPA